MTRHYWVQADGMWCRALVQGDYAPSASTLVASLRECSTVTYVVCGNPGVDTFYREFAEHMHVELALDRHAVVTLSHMNHVPLPREHEGSRHSRHAVFDLDEQTAHKTHVIRECTPPGSTVHLVGHSIGSYMCLHVAKRLHDEMCIARIICLFPTINDMAASPNGLTYQRHRRWGVHSLVTSVILPVIQFLLPAFLKDYLISMYLKGRTDSPHVHASISALLSVGVVRNVIYMSASEMDVVTELDAALLLDACIRDKCHYYIGTSDRWCPVEYGVRIAELVGDEHVTFCVDGCEHAFVIEHPALMARTTAAFIAA